MSFARSIRVVLAVVLVGAVPLVARAQTSTAPQARGAIEGAVFLDADGDTLFDVDESGLAGVRVRLSGEGLSRTDDTDEGGLYRFANLPDGTYTVRVAPQAPYEIADREEYEGLEVEGDNLASVDFALRRTSMSAASQNDATSTATRRATATDEATDEATATARATSVTAASATATDGPATAEATAPAAPTAEPAVVASPEGQATGEMVVTWLPTAAPSQVDGMPQTGIEDLGTGQLLALAVVLLVLVAGLGWGLERRG